MAEKKEQKKGPKKGPKKTMSRTARAGAKKMSPTRNFKKAGDTAAPPLPSAEERLRRAQEIAHIGDWEWDIATNAVTWSDELYRIYGFAPGAVLPDYGLVLERMHPDSKGEFLEAIDAALKVDRPFDMQYRFFRQDGAEAVLHTIGQVVRDRSGAPIRMYGIVQDITERKGAEDALRANEELLHSLVESSADAIFVKDIAGRYILFNAAGGRLVGRRPEEVLGRTDAELFAPDSAAAMRAQDKDIIGNARAIMYENVITLAAGPRLMQVHKGPLRDGQKRVIGVYGISRDITERKQVEEAVRESEERFRSIYDHIGIGITLISRDMRILALNPHMQKWFPHVDAGQGHICYQAFNIPPREEVCSYCPTIHTLEDGQVHTAVTDTPTPDGTRHYQVISTPLRDEQGSIIAAIEMVEDVTDRKRSEAALRKREQQLAESQRIAHIGSWEHNLKTGQVFWSDELFRLLGLDPEKDPGDFDLFFERVHPEDQPVLRAAIGRTLREKVPFAIDYRFVLGDGTVRDIFARAELLSDDGGEQVILRGTAQDVTEHNRKEMALRESERRLRTLLDAIPDAVFFKDREGRHIIDNKASETLFGLTPEMLAGKTAEDLMPPEIAAGCRKNDEDVLTKGTIVRAEERSVDGHGRPRVLDTIRVPLYDERGNSMGLVGIVRDITERKLAEELLQESEDRFRSVFTHAMDGILILDLERGSFIEANPKMGDMLGYSKKELLQLGVRDIHPEHDLPGVQNVLDRQLRGEFTLAEDIPMRRKDGSVFFADINAARVTMGGRKCLAGIFRDVSARKRAEEQILESERFIRGILDTVDEGFIVIDRDYRIVTANKAYCGQVGLPCEEVIGRHCFAISHKTSRPCYEEGEDCAVRHVFMTGEPHAVLHRHTDQEGQVLYVETKAFPLRDREGNVISAIETIANITERHLLEEERLKTQKLESIGMLAGGIAHDFNNLLQGVFGYISMAKMTFDDKERSLDMLEQAERALQQSVNLTSQLLTFSKGGKPVKTIIDLRPVIENAARFALSGSRSNLRMDLEPDLWADADAGQIGQVVQNIVLNAGQSMPHGGSVCISARNVKGTDPSLPKTLATRDHVLISIEDSGDGIPTADISRIFDPYFTTKDRGSGLGLATSYSIVRNHEGRIDVQSTVGKGSAFLLYLPAAQVRPTAIQEIAAAADGADRPGRVLVMDDEDIVRLVAGELVKSLGHEAAYAASGEEVVEEYRKAMEAGRPYDVVILDLTVRGGMGGAEAVKRLQAIDPAVKAVVTSGYYDDAITAAYEEHGFRAYLRKPYDIQSLQNVLHALLN